MEQDERVDELKTELGNQSNNVAGAFAKLSAIDDRLETVEEAEAEVDPHPIPMPTRMPRTNLTKPP